MAFTPPDDWIVIETYKGRKLPLEHNGKPIPEGTKLYVRDKIAVYEKVEDDAWRPYQGPDAPFQPINRAFLY